MDTTQYDPAARAPEPSLNDKLLFWACFASIVATAFGFVIRSQIVDDWARQYGLGETQVGKIIGVGLWPFAISIVIFSLIIDKIGYGKAMAFAFLCHISSAILTILTPRLATTDAQAYNYLYFSTFILALGNGTVEAVANPVVANLFPRDKTKYLNMLHAGWPGGLVLGGIIALVMGDSVAWEYKVGLIFLPVIAYAALMIGRKFPISERVTAGVSFNAMLREVGVIGAAIILAMIVRQLGDVFLTDFSTTNSNLIQLGVWLALVLAYGYQVAFAPGQPLFIVLMLIMIPLATTELGTDSWISPLMEPAMGAIGLGGGLGSGLYLADHVDLAVFRGTDRPQTVSPRPPLCQQPGCGGGLVVPVEVDRDHDPGGGNLVWAGQVILLADDARRRGRTVPQGWCAHAQYPGWPGDARRGRARWAVPGVHPGHQG